MSHWKGIGILAGAVVVAALVAALLPARAPAGLPTLSGGPDEQGAAFVSRTAQPPELPVDDVVAEASAGVPAEMRRQFADIARTYAENARFPDYAKPLATADWNLLHPRAFVPREAALANVPGVTATLEIAQSIVDRGVVLPVTLRMHAAPGAATATAASVTLQQKGRRSDIVALAVTSSGADAVFAGSLSASVLRGIPDGETVVNAGIVFANGERSQVTAMVTLYEPAAQLVRIGDPRIDAADLVIPLQFAVRDAGQYRVSANLFDAASGEPVSHLEGEFPLSADIPVQQLKVHAVTLRAKGSPGPYVLRDIDITRLPDVPGEPSGHGTATPDTYAVRGFPLEAYGAATYEDPAAAERLAFLQKLAGIR